MSRNVKLLVVAAAVVVMATPSLAASPDHAVRQDVRDSASNSTLVFRNDGKFLGKDPDVNVRFELLRDGYADEN
jgi:hypothetical protein